MKIYDKRQIVDFVWQYSRFYGNKLLECERYFTDGEGYVALILLFEIAENICKSVTKNYNSNFNVVVKKLKDTGKITGEEEAFLSTNEFSIRKIRNKFAHANLMAIHIVQNENGRDVYYPLTEEDSCLLLYDKISLFLFNILLKVISDDLKIDVRVELDDLLKNLELKIVQLSANDVLRMLGFTESYFNECDICETDLQRLANNSSSVDVLTEIFKGLKETEIP